jgi:hypothetical protein
MVACKLAEQQHGKQRNCNTFIDHNLFGDCCIGQLLSHSNGNDHCKYHTCNSSFICEQQYLLGANCYDQRKRCEQLYMVACFESQFIYRFGSNSIAILNNHLHRYRYEW